MAFGYGNRKPERYLESNLSKWIEIGSPGPSVNFIRYRARAYAATGADHASWMMRAMLPTVLGHRFSLSYDALPMVQTIKEWLKNRLIMLRSDNK
ncbi:hypothetical protein O9929_23120 [Vibrio lentus]|nr:hypothetical protein [Vibrio lentus]